MDLFLKLIGPIVTLLICLGGAFIAIGRLKQMIAQNEKISKQNSDDINVIFKLLNGVVTKDHCEKQADKCRLALCNKINEVRANVIEIKHLVIELHDKQTDKIEELDTKREAAKDNISKELGEIKIFMGKVEHLLNNERYMTQHSV